MNTHPSKCNTYSPAARRVIDPRYPAEHGSRTLPNQADHHTRTLPNQAPPPPPYHKALHTVPVRHSPLNTSMASSHPDNLHSNHVTPSLTGSHGNLDTHSYHSKLQGSHRLHSANEGGYNVQSRTYFDPRQQEQTPTMVTLSDADHDGAYISNDVMV